MCLIIADALNGERLNFPSCAGSASGKRHRDESPTCAPFLRFPRLRLEATAAAGAGVQAGAEAEIDIEITAEAEAEAAATAELGLAALSPVRRLL